MRPRFPGVARAGAPLAMLELVRRLSPLLPVLLLLPFAPLGCSRPSLGGPASSGTAVAQQREANDAIRAELEVIPPPTKAKFSTVRSLDSWENPYLTVGDQVITLHVLGADPIPNGIGQGGFLRPTSARRQTLTLRLSDLPAALEAVPHSSWPYGRVVALEEAHNTPRSAEPDVRRTMETVLRTLSDLGVVTYEWTEAGPEIR